MIVFFAAISSLFRFDKNDNNNNNKSRNSKVKTWNRQTDQLKIALINPDITKGLIIEYCSLLFAIRKANEI